MAHSKELIEKIRLEIQKDYPENLFRYEIEKYLPGTKLIPDILVRDENGKIYCAVEIGYTRPEKLTAYWNSHRIPDVRWYDKAGVLHTKNWNAESMKIIARQSPQPIPINGLLTRAQAADYVFE